MSVARRTSRDVLPLGRGRTLVLGILNATRDSFHAASRTPSLDAALAAADAMVAAGADALDVGGESTRPGATPVAAADEIERVVPLIEALRRRGLTLPISVDTYKSDVARAAVDAGASVVNDVAGGLLDPHMPATVAALGVPVIIGHLRGTPATMASHARYDDVVAEVRSELAERMRTFLDAGVAEDDILLDPGIGFAKQASDSLSLLRRLDALATLGRPLVVGVSRKRFVDEAMRAAGLDIRGDTDERLEGSLAAAVLAAAGGAAIIRAHDVGETRRALAIADAVLHEA